MNRKVMAWGVMLLVWLTAGCVGPTGPASSALSSAKALLSFSVDGDAAVGVVDEKTHTGSITLAAGASFLNRTVRFTVSPQASVSPASGSKFTFQTGSSVVVTAQDGSKQTYQLTAARALSNAAQLLGASFLNAAVEGAPDQSTGQLTLAVPAGTDLTSVQVIWTISDGASAAPPTGSLVDFSTPVTVRVTAQDGSFRDYTVALVESPAS